MKYIGSILIWLLVLSVNFGAQASTTYASAGIGFSVKDGDLQNLKTILYHYAEQNLLQFEDIGPRFPLLNNQPIFWVSLAKGDFIEITATNIGDPTHIQLLFYTTNSDPHSGRNADLLIAVIRKSWANTYPLQVHP